MAVSSAVRLFGYLVADMPEDFLFQFPDFMERLFITAVTKFRLQKLFRTGLVLSKSSH
jgi:hypothetical protein